MSNQSDDIFADSLATELVTPTGSVGRLLGDIPDRRIALTEVRLKPDTMYGEET